MTTYADAVRKAGNPVEMLQGTSLHFDDVAPAIEVGDKVIDFNAKRAFAVGVPSR